MPADIEFRYSMGNTGASGAQTDPDASLGGTISTTVVGGNPGNVFSNITSTEAATGRVEYRMLYVVNVHPTLTLASAVVWVDLDSARVDVALDTAAVGANSTRTVPDETTAPAGITFLGTAVSQATALTIGDLAPGAKKAFWQKLTVPANAANAIRIPGVRVGGITEV